LGQIVTTLIALFIVYRIYLRVRRSIGWQQLKPRKLLYSTVFLTIIGFLFLFAGGLSVASVLSDLAGACIGGLLAYYSSATTRFQQRDGTLYYNSSLWISFTVMALFFGRLAYRFYMLFFVNGDHVKSMEALTSIGSSPSPWMSGLMLIMFVYYIVYNISLLTRKHKHVELNTV